MKCRFFAGAVAVALAIITGGGVPVEAATDDQFTGAWFVELSGSVDAFRSKAKASGIEYAERYVYKRIWNGVSVQSTAEAASRLGKLEGVKAVFARRG